MPDAQVRFVGARPGPVAAECGVLFLGVTHTFAEDAAPDIVVVPGSGPPTADRRPRTADRGPRTADRGP